MTILVAPDYKADAFRRAVEGLSRRRERAENKIGVLYAVVLSRRTYPGQRRAKVGGVVTL